MLLCSEGRWHERTLEARTGGALHWIAPLGSRLLAQRAQEACTLQTRGRVVMGTRGKGTCGEGTSHEGSRVVEKQSRRSTSMVARSMYVCMFVCMYVCMYVCKDPPR